MDATNNENNVESGISFAEISILIKKYFFHVLIIVLSLTIIGGACSFFLIKPSYTASATVMVNYVPDTSTAANDRNALLYSLELTKTVEDLAKSNLVKNRVAEELEKKNIGVTDKFDFRNDFEVKVKDDSVVMTLAYETTKSPEFAVEVINQVVDSLIQIADSTENAEGEETKATFSLLCDSIKPVDKAVGATKSEKWPLYTLISFAIGLFVSAAYLFVVYKLDDTVKSKADLESITGYKTIAFIYDLDSADKFCNK